MGANNQDPSDRLLLTYYGDDFSGSTDVLEALSVRGVPTVLFLQPPSLSDLARFPDCRAVGVAGLSRSQSPEWMDSNLPTVFRSLKALGAPLCHYKVCSTFDSSPTHGSIGRAVEIGRQVFDGECVPMIVGAPVLRRYVVFGNLFATVDGTAYRLDRHPTMSRHPITPMDEADLARHFARQSDLCTGSVDLLALQAGQGLERFRQLREQGVDVVFFDTLDTQTLRESGRAIWEARSLKPTFLAGSSGVEYALLAWWHEQGLLPAQPPSQTPESVDRMLVVSGSCSPVTAGQIEWAKQNGFTGLAVNPAQLIDGNAEYQRVFEGAEKVLAAGGSPLIFSAAGPQDVLSRADGNDPSEQIALRLGAMAGELVRRCGLRRTVIAGGDTSGRAGQALNIHALTLVRPFAPGSPLCRISSPDPQVDGGEILFKGGQVGSRTLFGDVRQGRPA
jgi:uncharacterized protein YgbK (DUF1537 family)